MQLPYPQDDFSNLRTCNPASADVNQQENTQIASPFTVVAHVISGQITLWGPRLRRALHQKCLSPGLRYFKGVRMLGRTAKILWLRACGPHGIRRIQWTASSNSSKGSKYARALGVGLLGAGTLAVWMKTASNEGRNAPGHGGAPPAPTAEGWAAAMNIPAGRLHRQSTMFDKEESDEICVTVGSKRSAHVPNSLALFGSHCSPSPSDIQSPRTPPTGRCVARDASLQLRPVTAQGRWRFTV